MELETNLTTANINVETAAASRDGTEELPQRRSSDHEMIQRAADIALETIRTMENDPGIILDNRIINALTVVRSLRSPAYFNY